MSVFEKQSLIDTGNNSTTALLADQTFTGKWIDVSEYSTIEVAVASDVDGAADGLEMQFSPDGINVDHIHHYSIAAPGVSYTQAAELRFFRVVYTNGSTDQSYLRLTTILKKHHSASSRYTFDQPVTGKQFADTVKAVIYGKTTAGSGAYLAVKVTPSGALAAEFVAEALSVSSSTALESGHLAVATAGKLFSVEGVNTSASDQYIMIFDAASAPADGAIPAFVLKAVAGSNFKFDFEFFGFDFVNGIYICNSSTIPAKTIGAADCFFSVRFRLN